MGAGEDEKQNARELILKRMTYLADRMQGEFLFGAAMSVADACLFVMLLWARKNGVEVPAKLAGMRDRMMERPAVQKAMMYEGLT